MSRAPLLSLTALRVLAVTALSFSMLSACGKAEESAQEAATEAAIEAVSDADVDVEDGGQTVAGVDDEGRHFTVTQGDAATLPKDFPTDMVVPEGLVLDTAMVVGDTMMIGGALSTDRTALASRIDTGMKAEGWTSLMAMTEADTLTQVWQRDGRSASYVIETRDDGTLGMVISHSIEPKAEGEAAPST